MKERVEKVLKAFENKTLSYRDFKPHDLATKSYELIKELWAKTQAQEWQPISTAPKDGTQILLTCGGKAFTGKWELQLYNKNPKPYWQASSDMRKSNIRPTHWQPLPAAPQPKEGE